MTRPWAPTLIAMLLAASAGCASSTSGSSTRTEAELGLEPARAQGGTPAAGESRKPGAAADARFMRGMIGHHEQALTMSALVPTRTGRDDLRLLAQRIDVSQRDEIAWIQRWLRDHSQPSLGADSTHGTHGEHGTMRMPGMLSAAELARLAGSRAGEFDRLFLEYMIRHHEGALVMVSELLGAPGAGQEPSLFRFASDVDADQRSEISRMRSLQRTPPR